MPPSVVLLGRSDRTEFAPVHAALASQGVHVTAHSDAAWDSGSPVSADVWIVCQSWPDEFSPSAVRRIIDASAASRLICACGAWCDSDGRTRNVWPQAVRVPLHEFTSRLRYELEVLAGRALPLPITAARDEQFAIRVRSLH
jgi:hypothetical protein